MYKVRSFWTTVGFKFSLLSHKDLAMMQFGSTLLQSGTETQINIKPTVSYATKEAISTFAPKVRDCQQADYATDDPFQNVNVF